MSASPKNFLAILIMACAAMLAKSGGFIAMRWLGRHRFVSAWLDHAPGSVLVAAATVPIASVGGSYVAGAVVARLADGFTPGLFAAIGAVALARWAGLA